MNLHPLRLAAAALTVLAVAPFAATAQTTVTRTPAAADEGWRWPWQGEWWGHAGVSAGRSELDITCPPGFGCDDADQAFRIYGGGRFNKTFGGEIGYLKLGDFRRAGGETEGEAWDFVAIAGVPFGTNWNVFGKLGAAYTRAEVTAAPGTGVQPGTVNGWGLRYGLGLQAGITQNLSIRGDWDRFRFDMPGDRENIDVYLIGVQYDFR